MPYFGNIVLILNANKNKCVVFHSFTIQCHPELRILPLRPGKIPQQCYSPLILFGGWWKGKPAGTSTLQAKEPYRHFCYSYSSKIFSAREIKIANSDFFLITVVFDYCIFFLWRDTEVPFRLSTSVNQETSDSYLDSFLPTLIFFCVSGVEHRG